MGFLRQESRSLFSALVLLVLLFRSLIPMGFMPGKATGDRLVPLVICTGTGMATVYVSPDQVPPAHPQDKEDRAPCVFAPVFAQGLLSSSPVLTQVILQFGVVPFQLAEFLLSSIVFKSYLSQAPPFIPVHI